MFQQPGEGKVEDLRRRWRDAPGAAFQPVEQVVIGQLGSAGSPLLEKAFPFFHHALPVELVAIADAGGDDEKEIRLEFRYALARRKEIAGVDVASQLPVRKLFPNQFCHIVVKLEDQRRHGELASRITVIQGTALSAGAPPIGIRG